MEGKDSLTGVLMTGLLIVALCVMVSGVRREYHYIEGALTWLAAQQYCRKNSTDLALISNQAEAEKVSHISTGVWSWIGLYKDTNDPTLWKWSSGVNSAFKLWAPGEPNNAGGNEDCAFARWDKTWNDWLLVIILVILL